MPARDPLLAEFAAFLRERHLDALARENLAIAASLDVPLLRLFAHLSPDALLAMSRQGLDDFLAGLADGTAIDRQEAALRAWEADALPGIARDAVEPGDLVLANASQRRGLIRFIPRFTADQAATLAIVEALDAYYQEVQLRTFALFTRLREEGAQRAARLAAENEEIAVQNEELEEVVARRTAELADEKRFIETIVANVPTALAYMDRDLRYRWVNPPFARLFGKDPAAFLGKTREEAFGPADRPSLAAEVLESGEPRSAMGHRFVHEVDGRPLETWWDYGVVPHFDEAGAVQGVVLIAQEVSARVERDRLQEATITQLREVDRLKDEFLSVISHELRTPLNFIMGFASLLGDEVPGALNAEQRRYVERILGGADRMLLLVQDLLDFAAMQAGRFTLHRQPVAPRELVDEVVATLRPLADQFGVAIHAEPAPEEPVDVDGARIVQVLTNLASNGLKFTPGGGTVTIQAAIEEAAGGRTLVMAVRDTGIGIQRTDLPKLFGRFQQLNMGPTREVGGTGLGLSIVKALVEAHGGTIGVTSTPGAGSVFRFEIPLP